MAYFTRYEHSHGLLHRSLAFEPVDVLADGLEDDIRSEQQEQGIMLEDAQDASNLSSFWETALNDARKDPNWNFTNDEDNAPLF
jgi:hypothetical protein